MKSVPVNTAKNKTHFILPLQEEDFVFWISGFRILLFQMEEKPEGFDYRRMPIPTFYTISSGCFLSPAKEANSKKKL